MQIKCENCPFQCGSYDEYLFHFLLDIHQESARSQFLKWPAEKNERSVVLYGQAEYDPKEVLILIRNLGLVVDDFLFWLNVSGLFVANLNSETDIQRLWKRKTMKKLAAFGEGFSVRKKSEVLSHEWLVLGVNSSTNGFGSNHSEGSGADEAELRNDWDDTRSVIIEHYEPEEVYIECIDIADETKHENSSDDEVTILSILDESVMEKLENFDLIHLNEGTPITSTCLNIFIKCMVLWNKPLFVLTFQMVTRWFLVRKIKVFDATLVVIIVILALKKIECIEAEVWNAAKTMVRKVKTRNHVNINSTVDKMLINIPETLPHVKNTKMTFNQLVSKAKLACETIFRLFGAKCFSNTTSLVVRLEAGTVSLRSKKPPYIEVRFPFGIHQLMFNIDFNDFNQFLSGCKEYSALSDPTEYLTEFVISQLQLNSSSSSNDDLSQSEDSPVNNFSIKTKMSSNFKSKYLAHLALSQTNIYEYESEDGDGAVQIYNEWSKIYYEFLNIFWSVGFSGSNRNVCHKVRNQNSTRKSNDILITETLSFQCNLKRSAVTSLLRCAKVDDIKSRVTKIFKRICNTSDLMHFVNSKVHLVLCDPKSKKAMKFDCKVVLGIDEESVGPCANMKIFNIKTKLCPIKLQRIKYCFKKLFKKFELLRAENDGIDKDWFVQNLSGLLNWEYLPY